MAKPEYDSFFYKNTVVELADALTDDQSDLQCRFDKSNLFCPECRQAQLRFTRKTNARKAFLSTKRGCADNLNLHADTCSHSFTKASKAQVKRYYESLSEEQVQDKLNAAINLYLRRNAESGTECLPKQPSDNPGLSTSMESGHQIHRRLPKRSIYSIYNIEGDELGVPLMIHGIVKLKAEEKPSRFDRGETYFKLNIISLRTGNIIRRFNVKQLPSLINSEAEYYLAMIVVFTRDQHNLLKHKLLSAYPPSLKYILAH